MGWEEALERRRRKESLVCVLNTSNHVPPYSFNCLLSSLSSTTFCPYSFLYPLLSLSKTLLSLQLRLSSLLFLLSGYPTTFVLHFRG